MKKHLPHLLVAASLLLLPSPALASRLESWQFDANRNQLEFITDEDVQPTAQLIADPTRLVIDLPGIQLGRPSFTQSVGEGAIRSVRFGQFDQRTTRIVVELAPGYALDPNQVRFRGITARRWSVQLPTPTQTAQAPIGSAPPSSSNGGSTLNPPLSTHPTVGTLPLPTTRPIESPTPRPLPPAPTSRLATIEAVTLEGSQLVIRSNQIVRYSTSWEMSTGFYRITINSAQLGQAAREPQLNASSAIREVRFRQDTPQTVVILVKPAIGVQIGGLNQVGSQLALQLQRRGTTAPPSRPIGSIPVPTPPQPTAPTPSQRPIPNGRTIVVIDPGHGGPDPGAVGIGGLRETDIVLDIGKKVTAILQQQGIQVILTRNGEYDLDLEPRVQMAEQANASVFVSIHANSIDLSRPDISGLETYYYESGLELAQTIHNSILQSIDIPDRRVRSARFYVLRKTTMPATLVEVGFVTGRDDADHLSDPTYRSQMATAIARGILQYIQKAARP